MFRNAKVGDKVVDVARGEGVIVGIYLKSSYPISAHLDAQADDGDDVDGTYTLGGHNLEGDPYPSLFYADGYVPPVPGREPERLPEFEFDEVILVKRLNEWAPRHFKEFDTHGRVICFGGGLSSKTATNSSLEFWSQFKKYED